MSEYASEEERKRRLREEAMWALADATALPLCVALAPFVLTAPFYERARDACRR